MTTRHPGYRLRIIHFSDLHERVALDGMNDERKATIRLQAAQRHRVLGAPLEEVLREIRAQGAIDLVCFTGDVADWGLPEEYAVATPRMTRLLEAAGVPRDRFFVVPGNHDVQRRAATEAWEKLRQLARTNARGLSDWMGNAKAPPGADPAWRDAIAARTAAFWQWVTVDLGRVRLAPGHAHPRLGYRDTLQLPGLPFPVQVLGLDSAWLAGDDNDAKKLHLSQGQVDLLARDEGSPLPGFRLALVHHPVEELGDGAESRRLLADTVDLLLHGHQHTPIAAEQVDPDRNLKVLAAGSLFEGDEGERWLNSFNLVEAHLDAAGRPLRYDITFWGWSEQGHWYRNGAIYKAAPDGRLTWPTSTTDALQAAPRRASQAPSLPAVTPVGEGGLRTEALCVIARQLLDDATPESLKPLFPQPQPTIASAIGELEIQPRRTRHDERTTFTIRELATRERGRQLVVAPRGAGKSFALWHAANAMMVDQLTIPLFLPLGRFASWSDMLDHIKRFTSDPEGVLKDTRTVVFLDGWSEFARRGGGDSDAHRKVLSTIGDRRIVASARHGSEHDARFEITQLEPFPGDTVRRILKIAFPNAAAPTGALLELLRLPLALLLHMYLGGPAATRGDLLAALQQRLTHGLPEGLTSVIARAAAKTALANERRRTVFEDALRLAGAELNISQPIELTRRLGTLGTNSIDVRPVHDLYWNWLVGVGLLESGFVRTAMTRLDLRESIELAIESGARVPQSLIDETRTVDAVLAMRLAASVTVGASAAPISQTQRMLADGRAAVRRRGVLAGVQSTDPLVFRRALDVLSELWNDGLIVPEIAENLRMDILWQQRSSLATWVGAKGTEQVLDEIAVRGDVRWVDWLEQLVSSERLAGDVAGPIAIACSQTIPGWTRPLLATLGENLYLLHHAADRGTNVDLALWAADQYQYKCDPSSWTVLNDILVHCGDGAAFETLLRRFETLPSEAQQWLGYAIVKRGEPWVSAFQRKAFANGNARRHHHPLFRHVSSLIDDETARRWIEDGPILLGWQVLIKRHGTSIVPELLARLPASFSDLHVVHELRALASLDDAPEAIVNELWSRLRGTITESVLEDVLIALSRVRLIGIRSVISRLQADPFYLPSLSFSLFLVLLAKWEANMGLQLRYFDGVKNRRFSEWIRLVRWERERDEPLVGHRVPQRTALPISDDVLDAWAAGDESFTKFVHLSSPLDRYHAKAVEYLLAQPSGCKDVLALFGDVLNKFPERVLLRVLEQTPAEGRDGFNRLLRAVEASNDPAYREFHAALIRHFLDQPSLDIHASRALAKVLRVHSPSVLRELLQEAITTTNGLWLLRDVEEAADTLLIDEEGHWLLPW